MRVGPHRRSDPQPLDVDPVRAVTFGTACWAIALAVALAKLPTLRAQGHLWWAQTCVAGLLLGFVGIASCRRRRTALRRQACSAGTEELPPPLV